MSKKGFTMIELIVAATIIGILAAIAIPSLYRMQRTTRENTAASTMRLINTAQAEFRTRALVDQDGDDIGEFGLLGELVGSINLRASTDKKVSAPLLAHTLAPVSTYGILEGYCYRIYLPAELITNGGTGLPVTDNGAVAPKTEAINANYQEHRFRAYAWPAGPKLSGCKVFAISQVPELYFASNETSSGVDIYQGSNGPSYNAATPSDKTDNSKLIEKFQECVGVDGQQWKVKR